MLHAKHSYDVIKTLLGRSTLTFGLDAKNCIVSGHLPIHCSIIGKHIKHRIENFFMLFLQTNLLLELYCISRPIGHDDHWGLDFCALHKDSGKAWRDIQLLQERQRPTATAPSPKKQSAVGQLPSSLFNQNRHVVTHIDLMLAAWSLRSRPANPAIDGPNEGLAELGPAKQRYHYLDS